MYFQEHDILKEENSRDDFTYVFDQEIKKWTYIDWIWLFHSTSGGTDTGLTGLYLDYFKYTNPKTIGKILILLNISTDI